MKKHSYMKNSLIATSLLLSLIGCTNHDNKNDAKKNIELTPIHVIAESPEAITLFRMEEKEIEKKYGVKLVYNYPQRITDRLEDYLFASKDKYDIYVIFPAKIPLYIERDMLLPLDSYIAKNPGFAKDIIPAYRKLYMNYGGHDYGMVYDGDTHLLFYRKDLFKRYNNQYKKQYGVDLTPPKTWKEYAQIAKFLTRDLDGDGKIDVYGTATLNADSKRYIWFAERFISMGGKYFDENMHPLITSKEGVRAIKEQLAIENSGATPPQSMYDWVDLNNAFLQGNVAMVVQFSDTARFSFDENDTWDSKVAGKVGWSLVPGETPESLRGGTWIGRVLAISKDSKNPDKAWQVIQHITSYEVSKDAIGSFETINDPFRLAHLKANGKGPFPNEAINQNFLDTVKESLKNPNVDLMIPGGWDYMQALDHYLYLAMIGKVTPEEALESTAVKWEELTDKYGREQQKKYYKEWLQKLGEIGNVSKEK
ncbi:ABC transporter substrate-binding protein [Schinkia sp. CFF1]